jgi:protein-S-isoprenylcysteine O-methyltransferase Ste14
MIALGVKHTHKIVANIIFVANMMLFFVLYFLHQNSTISSSFESMNISMLVMILLAAGGYFMYTYVFERATGDGHPYRQNEE